jgi:hypothetical protein
MNSVDERKLAEQIEAMRDDSDAWEESPGPAVKRRGSEKRQRGTVVSVRLTAEELERIQSLADATGLSLSGSIRDAALTAASAITVSRPRITAFAAFATATLGVATSAAEGAFFKTTSNAPLQRLPMGVS